VASASFAFHSTGEDFKRSAASLVALGPDKGAVYPHRELLDGSGNRRWSFDLADQLALDPLAHNKGAVSRGHS
jgi:hypothetical protein